MINLGDATPLEVIAYFDEKMRKRDVIESSQITAIAILRNALDSLAANAEPVCDSLEMGKALKSGKTLKSFRVALDRAWELLN